MASKAKNKSVKNKGGKTAKKATAKKAVKKVTKKATKKSAGKTAKKVTKKVAKKPAKKVVKKPTVKVKTAKKVVKKPAVKTKTPKKPTPVKNTKKSAAATATPTQTTNSAISGKNFLFTGTLTLMNRKEAEQDVKDHGGKVLSGVSDKLDYLVVGQKAGSKLKEAKKHKNVQIIDEADFLMMLPEEGDGGEDKGQEVDCQYKFKFHVYGYGAENCITSLNDTQKKFWKAKYKEDQYEAQQELKDHLWEYDYDELIKDTHFGKWYDQDSIVHAEKASYEGSKLVLTVFKNGQEVEEIEIDATDKKLKKDFFDEFVPDKKRNKGEAFLHTYSTDRGLYCYGEHELPEGEEFDLSKISLMVGKLFDSQSVWNVVYDGECLDDEGCYDSTGKGFYADIYFY